MNNLTFSQIGIISPVSKTAKIQKFITGINVVTSSKIKGGNWVGKSSLLKSLYHALGADSLFDDLWESDGDYIYILTFLYKNIEYTILRYRHMFKLYDSNKKVLFTVANREDLAQQLSLIFNIEIKLKDQSISKKYKDSLPVYWYLLNFTDQTDLKPCEFRSFDRLGASNNYYKDLIYSHLGVRSSALNEITSEIDDLNRRKNECDEQNKIYEGTYKLLKEKNTPISNEQVLMQSLEKYENEYRHILEKLDDVHSKLEKAYVEKADLETLLTNLDQLIAKQKEDIKDFEIKHECPHCGTILEDNKIYYFKRIKDIDGFGLQKISVENELALCERTIKLEMNKYISLKDEIDNIRKKLAEDSSIKKNDISNLGLEKTISEVLAKLNEFSETSNKIDKEIKSKLRIAKKLEDTRKEVDSYYCVQLSELAAKYAIPGFSVSNISTAVDKIIVSGTVNNVTKIIWLSALLKTRFDKNKSFPVFPVVVDTPNNADYDEENDKKIFDVVFNLGSFCNQIITSLIGFNREKYIEFGKINVIYLDNEQQKLLNAEDFEIAKNEYSFLDIF